MKWFVGCVLLALCLCSCRTSSGERAVVAARAHAEPAVQIELLPEALGADGVDYTLPQSGVPIRCETTPIATRDGITGADVVGLELGRALSLQLRPAALDRLSALDDLGRRRLVLVVDDRPIGVVRANQVRADGRLVMFVEQAAPDMIALANRLGSAAGGASPVTTVSP